MQGFGASLSSLLVRSRWAEAQPRLAEKQTSNSDNKISCGIGHITLTEKRVRGIIKRALIYGKTDAFPVASPEDSGGF